MRKIYNSVVSGFTEFLFPQMCLCCRFKTHSNYQICFKCFYFLPFLYEQNNNSDIVSLRLAESIAISRGFSLFTFKKGSMLQKIVHSIKYSGNQKLAVELGKILGKKIKQSCVEVDLIIPIPLHKKKKSLRGYNQSEMIAKGVSSELGIAVDNDIVYRTKHTKTQTKKNREERIKNVESIFEIKKDDENKLQNKKILLIDDILTTGATLTSCAQKFMALNIYQVNIAVLAIAV